MNIYSAKVKEIVSSRVEVMAENADLAETYIKDEVSSNGWSSDKVWEIDSWSIPEIEVEEMGVTDINIQCRKCYSFNIRSIWPYDEKKGMMVGWCPILEERKGVEEFCPDYHRRVDG